MCLLSEWLFVCGWQCGTSGVFSWIVLRAGQYYGPGALCGRFVQPVIAAIGMSNLYDWFVLPVWIVGGIILSSGNI